MSKIKLSDAVSIFLQKEYYAPGNRWIITLDVNGLIPPPLELIIEAIPGVEMINKTSKYSLSLIIGRMFSDEHEKIMADIKKSCLDYYNN